MSVRGTYARVALADRSCRVFSHDRTLRTIVLEWRGRTVVEGQMRDDAVLIDCIRAWVVGIPGSSLANQRREIVVIRE